MKMAPAEMQQEVMRLAEVSGGLLKPHAVVDAARAEESPLHGWFEWDDTAAAEAWRVEQARQLIQVTVTVIETSSQKAVSVRALVSLPRDRQAGGYRVVTTVLGDSELRAEMLADALAELNRVRQRYSTLRELAPVFAAIESLAKAS
jgi:hypothetical protein